MIRQSVAGSIQWQVLNYDPPGSFSGLIHGLNDVAYGNGVFVAVGDSIFLSTNGTNWAELSVPLRRTLDGVVFGNGKFVAVGGAYYLHSDGPQSVILVSEDGFHWTTVLEEVLQSTEADENGYRGFFLADVAYGNGRFVAVGTGAGKAVMTSTNGTNWQTIGTDMLRYCNSIAFGSDLFVGVGTGIITSTDGLTWNAQTIDRDSELRSVCYGGGIFVAVDYLGSVFTSTNGAYWSRVRDKDGSEMWSAGFGDGIFVAGGNGMLLEAGTDMSWVRVPTPLVEGAWPAEISGITYANGHFIGVGFLNLIVRGTVVPAPSRLSSPRANRDGTFEFFAQVKPNETYRIEVSEDLRSWSFVTNVTSQTTSSPLKFATPDKSRSIFYRVVHE